MGEISNRKKIVEIQRFKTKKSLLTRELSKAFKSGSVDSLSIADTLKDKVKEFTTNPSSVVGKLLINSVDGVDWYARVLRSLPNAKLLADHSNTVQWYGL